MHLIKHFQIYNANIELPGEIGKLTIIMGDLTYLSDRSSKKNQ